MYPKQTTHPAGNVTSWSPSPLSDELVMREKTGASKSRLMDQNLKRLDRIYESFENNYFNSIHDDLNTKGRTTAFNIVDLHKTRDQAIAALREQLTIQFPGMLPEFKVSESDTRKFKVFIPIEDLNIKYATCAEVLCSERWLWAFGVILVLYFGF